VIIETNQTIFIRFVPAPDVTAVTPECDDARLQASGANPDGLPDHDLMLRTRRARRQASPFGQGLWSDSYCPKACQLWIDSGG
jgi:hypothetical protein